MGTRSGMSCRLDTQVVLDGVKSLHLAGDASLELPVMHGSFDWCTSCNAANVLLPWIAAGDDPYAIHVGISINALAIATGLVGSFHGS